MGVKRSIPPSIPPILAEEAGPILAEIPPLLPLQSLQAIQPQIVAAATLSPTEMPVTVTIEILEMEGEKEEEEEEEETETSQVEANELTIMLTINIVNGPLINDTITIRF